MQIAESWYEKTALDDLLGVTGDQISDDRLYLALDALLPHKDEPCRHLQQRYGELFGCSFDFMTSTPGWTFSQLCSRSGCSNFFKLCCSPEGTEEIFVLCRSVSRKEKENAILNRFANRLETRLLRLAGQTQAGKAKDRQKVERRIGRLLERNSRAASLFSVEVMETGTGKQARLSINLKKNEDHYQWVLETGGSYILRTNWDEADPRTMWNTYIQLTEVEDSFRTEKYDLGMRPIFHHKQDRTQAHILVCFLALTMWRTHQQWMKASGLAPPRENCWRNYEN